MLEAFLIVSAIGTVVKIGILLSNSRVREDKYNEKDR